MKKPEIMHHIPYINQQMPYVCGIIKNLSRLKRKFVSFQVLSIKRKTRNYIDKQQTPLPNINVCFDVLQYTHILAMPKLLSLLAPISNFRIQNIYPHQHIKHCTCEFVCYVIHVIAYSLNFILL